MKAMIYAAFIAVALASPSGAWAQAYPAKPIRFVIGFPAGSTIDNVSRVILDQIRTRTGATIVVENKAGALGVIGVEAVMTAPPDGYTLMPSSSATNSSGPHLSKAAQKYDTVNGLTHVARIVRFDIVVVSSAAQGFPTAQDLINEARSKPDTLAYGYGSGTGQVTAAAFSKSAGIQVRGVPYKGQPPAINDLLGGHINFVAADLGAVLPHVRARTLVALVLTSDKRSNIVPAVPTARELGLADLDLVGWIGVAGPANMPAEVVQWWTAQLTAALAAPEVGERLRNMGIEPDLLVGEPFQRFVRDQFDKWGKQVRDARIVPE